MFYDGFRFVIKIFVIEVDISSSVPSFYQKSALNLQIPSTLDQLLPHL